MNESCHAYEWVMSHIWMRHVTHRMSHVIRINASCHTYESCHKYECVMSHIWMRHATHLNESCHTYECVMSRIWMRHVTHTQLATGFIINGNPLISWVNSNHHCNTLQHTASPATYCNTLQHTESHYNILQHPWDLMRLCNKRVCVINSLCNKRVCVISSLCNKQVCVINSLCNKRVCLINSLCNKRESSDLFFVINSNHLISSDLMSHVTHMNESCHIYAASHRICNKRQSIWSCAVQSRWISCRGLLQIWGISSTPSWSQCVAVCCSVLQCVAVCCSVVQCGAVSCSMVQLEAVGSRIEASFK